MKDNLLIDTSAWIISFKKSGYTELKEIILNAISNETIVTSNIIIMELLQGCRSSSEYHQMKARIEALKLLTITDEVWDIAYKCGFSLRRKGITISSIDIIIASIAKFHNCRLIHHDKHFTLISKELNLTAIDFLDSK